MSREVVHQDRHPGEHLFCANTTTENVFHDGYMIVRHTSKHVSFLWTCLTTSDAGVLTMPSDMGSTYFSSRQGNMLLPPESLTAMKNQLQSSGFSNLPLDRVIISFNPSFASQNFVSSGSWDASRREIVRGVLAEARTNFHRHPRPW